MAQALPVPPFPGGLPQPQGYPTRGRKKYKIIFSIKQRPLVIASWNVRNLRDTRLEFCANLAALPLLLPYYNNFILVCVLKLSWLFLSPPAFPLKWELSKTVF